MGTEANAFGVVNQSQILGCTLYKASIVIGKESNFPLSENSEEDSSCSSMGLKRGRVSNLIVQMGECSKAGFVHNAKVDGPAILFENGLTENGPKGRIITQYKNQCDNLSSDGDTIVAEIENQMEVEKQLEE